MLEDVLRRFWLFVAGLLVFLFILFLMREPILKTMGSYLVVQDDLKKADVIVVLAGDMERVIEAARIYRNGFSNYIIMSGGTNNPAITSTAEGMKEQAIRLGVPKHRIILEPLAQHTYEHPIFVKPILLEKGFKSAIVISSPYHMRRTALLFNRSFKKDKIKVVYYPVQKSWFKVNDWWKQTNSREAVLAEYAKMTVNVFGNRVSKFVDNIVKNDQ